jgi:putative Mg2+ transporter-C (MgtC) family protein
LSHPVIFLPRLTTTVRAIPVARSTAHCGFVQATEASVGTSAEVQARIIEGLITGIGFIGGGAAVGLGSYDVAIVMTLFTIFTFRVLSPIKQQETPGDDIGPPSGSQ